MRAWLAPLPGTVTTSNQPDLRPDQLRSEILRLTAAYHQAAFAPRTFVPGETPIPSSGKVFGAEEVQAVVEAGLDFWLTTGRFAHQFEEQFARWCGVRHALLVNSGSSANLVALSALTSSSLGKARLQPDDEVITIAAGFPTTVNPIVQNRLVPVFVDVELPSCNLDVSLLEGALSPRTRAVMVAHTLGQPFDAATVHEFCRTHRLYLIEDCCDALGARCHGQLVGTFGDLATVSFYPAHHLTMGEGGCVLVRSPVMKRLVESFRDWGRDCWCEPGQDNTCGKRFEWQLGDLPAGYDHKYTFSHLGYNLKATDMQAAVGCAQLPRLDGFIAARRANWSRLRLGLEDLQEMLWLPEEAPYATSSPFGFLMLVREAAPFRREDLTDFLERRRIGTRLMFGGNLTRQPAFKEVPFRVAGSLCHTDQVMEQAFWIGCYPGLTEEMLGYVVDSIHEFCRGY